MEYRTRNMEYGTWNTDYTEHGLRNTEHGIIIRNMEYETCTYIRKKIKAMGINIVTIRRLGNVTSQFCLGDNAMGRHGRGYAARKRF